MKTTTFLFFSLLSLLASAQVEMREAFGPSILKITDLYPNTSKFDDNYNGDDLSAFVAMVNYNLNYSGQRGIAFNAELSAGIGLNIASNGLNPAFVFNIPVSVQYLFGNLSQKNPEGQYGGFVGLGGCYLLNTHYLPYAYVFGPLVEGGVQLPGRDNPMVLKLKVMPWSNHDIWSASIGLLFPLKYRENRAVYSR